MAIASIIVGIFAGVVTFITALLSGYGLGAAFAFYVLGGFTTTFCLIGMHLLRGFVRTSDMGAREAAFAQG